MSFENYGLPKRWLDQCLESLFSEDPPKSNMVDTPKRFSNLNNSTFTILIDHWQVNCLTKSLD